MRLLVAVLHSEELLDDMLSLLLELELADSVVVESRSGLELLERDLPIFAGLRSLIPGGLAFSRLLLCAIADDALAATTIEALRRLGGERAHGSREPTTTLLLLPIEAMVTC